MIIPSTGRAEDRKHLCRAASGHQAAPPARISLWYFLLLLLFYSLSPEYAFLIMKPFSSFFMTVSFLTVLSRYISHSVFLTQTLLIVTPAYSSMQLIPRNTERQQTTVDAAWDLLFYKKNKKKLEISSVWFLFLNIYIIQYIKKLNYSINIFSCSRKMTFL